MIGIGIGIGPGLNGAGGGVDVYSTRLTDTNDDGRWLSSADNWSAVATLQVIDLDGLGTVIDPTWTFSGTDAFLAGAEDEITAFYLTDFLVRQFEAFVWKPMGFDRHPDLIGMMFGNYERLIYLAQTENPELDARARQWADRLSLTYERRFTGYGDLTTALARATR